MSQESKDEIQTVGILKEHERQPGDTTFTTNNYWYGVLILAEIPRKLETGGGDYLCQPSFTLSKLSGRMSILPLLHALPSASKLYDVTSHRGVYHSCISVYTKVKAPTTLRHHRYDEVPNQEIIHDTHLVFRHHAPSSIHIIPSQSHARLIAIKEAVRSSFGNNHDQHSFIQAENGVAFAQSHLTIVSCKDRAPLSLTILLVPVLVTIIPGVTANMPITHSHIHRAPLFLSDT